MCGSCSPEIRVQVVLLMGPPRLVWVLGQRTQVQVVLPAARWSGRVTVQPRALLEDLPR